MSSARRGDSSPRCLAAVAASFYRRKWIACGLIVCSALPRRDSRLPAHMGVHGVASRARACTSTWAPRRSCSSSWLRFRCWLGLGTTPRHRRPRQSAPPSSNGGHAASCYRHTIMRDGSASEQDASATRVRIFAIALAAVLTAASLLTPVVRLGDRAVYRNVMIWELATKRTYTSRSTRNNERSASPQRSDGRRSHCASPSFSPFGVRAATAALHRRRVLRRRHRNRRVSRLGTRPATGLLGRCQLRGNANLATRRRDGSDDRMDVHTLRSPRGSGVAEVFE